MLVLIGQKMVLTVQKLELTGQKLELTGQMLVWIVQMPAWKIETIQMTEYFQKVCLIRMQELTLMMGLNQKEMQVEMVDQRVMNQMQVCLTLQKELKKMALQRLMLLKIQKEMELKKLSQKGWMRRSLQKVN